MFVCHCSAFWHEPCVDELFVCHFEMLHSTSAGAQPFLPQQSSSPSRVRSPPRDVAAIIARAQQTLALARTTVVLVDKEAETRHE
jgi:hypothetical protein